MKRGLLIVTGITLCLIGSLTAGQSSSAVSSTDLTTDWWVIASGGVDGRGSRYRMEATIGQCVVQDGRSIHYSMMLGYWTDLDGVGCCRGRVGDVNGQGEYPDEVTLADVMLLVDVKFISGNCSKLPCLTEADVNQDGGGDPTCEDNMTLSDIMTLVDFLFITGPENATLPDCL